MDLARNNVVVVEGLENLLNLRILKLADNPKLDMKKTMAQLANHSKLEQVSFCVRDFKHPRYYRQKKYRLAALSVLLKKNK